MLSSQFVIRMSKVLLFGVLSLLALAIVLVVLFSIILARLMTSSVTIELPKGLGNAYYHRTLTHLFQPEYTRTLNINYGLHHPLLTNDGRCGDVEVYWIDEGKGFLRLQDECGNHLFDIDADICYLITSGLGDGKEYISRLSNDHIDRTVINEKPHEARKYLQVRIDGARPGLASEIVGETSGEYLGLISNSKPSLIFIPAREDIGKKVP